MENELEDEIDKWLDEPSSSDEDEEEDVFGEKKKTQVILISEAKEEEKEPDSKKEQELCHHDGLVYGGICTLCFKDVSHLPKRENNIKAAVINSNLYIPKEQSEILQTDQHEKLLRDKKLMLVLDLDSTLIFAQTPHKFQRPHLQDFLEFANKFFEMTLYTMGTQAHALKSLKAIDPDGKYFATRVISRESLESKYEKRLDYLMTDPKIVLIMDDTPDVWHNHLKNLILVPPYIGQDIDDFFLEIIPTSEDLHNVFFSTTNSDIQHITQSKYGSLLDGVHIVFSGVFRTEDDPSDYTVWQLAQCFGAQCHYAIDEKTTHLIARSPTAKVKEARRKKIFYYLIGVVSRMLSASSKSGGAAISSEFRPSNEYQKNRRSQQL